MANATGKRLNIFYHKKEIKLEDLLSKEDSKTTERLIKPNAEMSFMTIAPNDAGCCNAKILIVLTFLILQIIISDYNPLYLQSM